MICSRDSKRYGHSIEYGHNYVWAKDTHLLPPQALDHMQHQLGFDAALESQMLQQLLQHQAGHTLLQRTLVLRAYPFHPVR